MKYEINGWEFDFEKLTATRINLPYEKYSREKFLKDTVSLIVTEEGKIKYFNYITGTSSFFLPPEDVYNADIDAAYQAYVTRKFDDIVLTEGK